MIDSGDRKAKQTKRNRNLKQSLARTINTVLSIYLEVHQAAVIILVKATSANSLRTVAQYLLH